MKRNGVDRNIVTCITSVKMSQYGFFERIVGSVTAHGCDEALFSKILVLSILRID